MTHILYISTAGLHSSSEVIAGTDTGAVLEGQDPVLEGSDVKSQCAG